MLTPAETLAGPRDEGGPGSVGRTAADLRRLVDDGWALPLPGSGRTAERWQALSDLGERDLALARLAEGHADALAVLAELGGPAPAPGALLGVWAAEPPDARLTARRVAGGWRLDGPKAWCSGARTLTAVLVTASADDGRRLFLAGLDRDRVAVDADRWTGHGMRGSDTADVVLTDLPAQPVGPVEAYVERPGLWHGGIGVAAVWAGGARRLVRALAAAAAARGDDPLAALALGTADVATTAAGAALAVAAQEVDRDPRDLAAARLRALRVRSLVAGAVDVVLTTTARALGPGPLAHDPAHDRHVADLEVYVRQHHGDRDLAALGRLLAAEGDA